MFKMKDPRPGTPPITDEYLLGKSDESLRRIYDNVPELHAEFPNYENFQAYVQQLRSNQSPVSRYGQGLTPTTTKQFPKSFKCDDAMLKETGGSPVLLKALWKKFPALQSEFSDYATFEAYAQSVVAGKSKIYGAGTVISSRESDHLSLAAKG